MIMRRMSNNNMIHQGQIVNHIADLPRRILRYDWYMATDKMPKTRKNKFKSWCLKFEWHMLFWFMLRFRMIELFPPNPEVKKENIKQ